MKILPGMSRPTEAAPEDVGIFLKTPLRLLHVLQGTPDENLDPLDRVVAALRWRILLEGTALGFMDRRLGLFCGLFPVEFSLDFLVCLVCIFVVLELFGGVLAAS